jgi:hypothetical protein
MPINIRLYGLNVTTQNCKDYCFLDVSLPPGHKILHDIKFPQHTLTHFPSVPSLMEIYLIVLKKKKKKKKKKDGKEEEEERRRRRRKKKKKEEEERRRRR